MRFTAIAYFSLNNLAEVILSFYLRFIKLLFNQYIGIQNLEEWIFF